MQQNEFLSKAYAAAQFGGHIFPQYAACEAALESAWGSSKLAVEGYNLFGEKQHQKPIYETLSLPTKEYLNSGWVTVQANWVKFPNRVESFRSRMATLQRLRVAYPNYGRALDATNGEDFGRFVSRSWSTDPLRADKVLTIFRNHCVVFG